MKKQILTATMASLIALTLPSTLFAAEEGAHRVDTTQVKREGSTINGNHDQNKMSETKMENKMMKVTPKNEREDEMKGTSTLKHKELSKGEDHMMSGTTTREREEGMHGTSTPMKKKEGKKEDHMMKTSTTPSHNASERGREESKVHSQKGKEGRTLGATTTRSR